MRILADDLTGALDAAAAFAPAFGALTAGPAEALPDSADAATRELAPAAAASRAARFADQLAPADGRVSFLKVDSLLRGSAGAEIDAILAAWSFDRVIVAPAMPFQGRITRGGRQMIRDGEGWSPTGEDIGATLRALGRSVSIAGPDAIPETGLSIVDAESSPDLAAAARRGLALTGRTLFVGTAGLAEAIAGEFGGRASALPELRAPVLGLIGSDHRIMQAQLATVAGFVMEAEDDAEADEAAGRLASDGAAFIVPRIPPGVGRRDAAVCIANLFGGLAARLDPPGLLMVSGGETLRALISPLGARCLSVEAALEPGAALSRLSGGRWDGVPVLSKSGAFGAPDFLDRLLALTGIRRKTRTS